MDDSTAGFVATAATTEGAAAPESERREFERELAASPTTPSQLSGGQEAAPTEAVGEPAVVTGAVERAADSGAVALEPTALGRRRVVSDPGQSLLEDIEALKEAQKKAKEAKKQVTKDLRNANRRRQRLKRRAKALTDQDLLAVITLRNHEKALGRKVSAEEEIEDDDSDSEDDGTTAAGIGGSLPSSPVQPKKQARGA